MPSQLPFFVASCDYTLIGEEFFAASAYLSNDPLQIGSLKGQDYGKFFSVFILVIGILFATISGFSNNDSRDGFAAQTLSFITDNMLSVMKLNVCAAKPSRESLFEKPLMVANKMPMTKIKTLKNLP